MTVLAIAIGGSLGAVARYLTDRSVARRFGTAFPWGTLVVNVVGSFLFGLVVARSSGTLTALLGTGFCGALTTYSSFAAESVGLIEEGAPAPALANVALSVILGVLAYGAGMALG